MHKKYRNVVLKKLEPFQYAKYLSTHTGSRRESYVYTDPKYDWSEILFEQINDGFWVFYLETKEQADTCYVIKPKNTTAKYFSINYYEAASKLGFETEGQINWSNHFAVLVTPLATHKIYVRKHVNVKCYRLVFTSKYLNEILNISEHSFSESDLGKILFDASEIFARKTLDTEYIQLQRIYHILKYQRQSFNFLLSITSSAFQVTDYFFTHSVPENSEIRLLKDDIEMISEVALRLGKDILQRFPGISALAVEANMSPTKLKEGFKDIYRVTPLVYFRMAQMAYALEILRRKELTVQEISRQLSFKKSSTFSLWFKRYTGKNPKEV